MILSPAKSSCLTRHETQELQKPTTQTVGGCACSSYRFLPRRLTLCVFIRFLLAFALIRRSLSALDNAGLCIQAGLCMYSSARNATAFPSGRYRTFVTISAVSYRRSVPIITLLLTPFGCDHRHDSADLQATSHKTGGRRCQADTVVE